LKADWFIEEEFKPYLQQARTPFRPKPKPGMQQVRVRLKSREFNFEYLFGKASLSWVPVLNTQKKLNYEPAFAKVVEGLQPVQPETREWHLVSNLVPEEEIEKIENTQNQIAFNKQEILVSQYQIALKAMEPESGAFILFSTKRRKMDKSGKI